MCECFFLGLIFDIKGGGGSSKVKKCDGRKSDRKLKALIKKSFDLGFYFW